MKIKVSEKLNKLAKAFGHDNPLLIVGGYVRNMLCRLDSHDIDLASCLTIDQVKKILPQGYNIKVKSKELNTCEISCGDETYEYATFRREIYNNGGEHKPSIINFDATIVEDVSRRDFTCNSLYYDIIDQKLIDFYGGEKDIKDRKIKTIETPDFVLKNDGERILRMIRFACELNFVIDNETYIYADQYKNNLSKISIDRKREEFLKILKANLTYKKIDRKSLFNKNRAYNGIKLIDKMDLWQYFSADERIKNLRGIGAYLTCFIKEKENPVVAFFVDAYYYLKRLEIINSTKDFENAFLGSHGLNLSKQAKKEIIDIIKNLEIAENLDQKELFYQVDFTNKHLKGNALLQKLLKIKNPKAYAWAKKLL